MGTRSRFTPERTALTAGKRKAGRLSPSGQRSKRVAPRRSEVPRSKTKELQRERINARRLRPLGGRC